MSNEIKPLVSVCCLVYNHEPYLRDCFEGFVKQQTTFPFEILVHDDASTDHSADIIREYTAKYPHLFKPIYQTENQYSKGIRVTNQYQYPRAQGKYIAICEGDDYWTDPNKLQMQVDFLEAHPDYSMCFHGANLKIEGSLYTHAKCEHVQDKDYTAEDLLKQWIVPTASIVMKRECAFYPIMGRERVRFGDCFIVFSCLALGKVRGFSRFMSTYRVNSFSITYSPALQKDNILKMPENWECFKENFPFADQKIVNRLIAFHHWQRAKIQPTIKKAFLDRRIAFAYSPILSCFLVFRPFFLIAKKILSKCFDEKRINKIVENVVSHL